MKKTLLLIIAVLSSLLLGWVVLMNATSLCWGLGCTGGYEFNDTAIYYAPKSDFKAIIHTSGFVPEGHDLGDGIGEVKLFQTKSILDTIYIKVSTNGEDSISWKGQTSTIRFANDSNDLYQYLDSIGVENLYEEELIELSEAILNVNYGPKAGFCEGQTKFIEVVQRE